MSSTNETLALLEGIIKDVREEYGDHQIPYEMHARTAYDLIGSIKKQLRDLKRSGAPMPLPELTKLVCEAKVFSPDKELNWFLQYAYQPVALKYFGTESTERASRNRYHSEWSKALTASGGRG